VELDLTRLPVDGRKTFAVQLRLTGLVPESFAPRVQTKFDSHFSVRMLGAQ
jgi:hypothetical protein